MPKFDLVGDSQPMNKGKAQPTPDKLMPRSGMFELVGDVESMNHNKTIQSPSANPPCGQFQIVGDSTPMSRNPLKGWGDAAKLTMSDRAVEQSKTVATGGKKRK